MKVLLVHPGASWSIADLHRGLRAALERARVEVIDYAMDGRIAHSGEFLTHAWKASQKKGKIYEKPGPPDFIYHASMGILERALRHYVDWVLIVSGMYVHLQTFGLLRRAGLRTAVVLTESPYADEHELAIASAADVVWTNERTSVGLFEQACHEVYYYQHAYDPAIHQPRDEHDPEVASHDVVFVGTGFEERCDLLNAVNWDGIDLGLYGSWDLLGSRSKLRKHLHNHVVPNEVTAKLYRQAKIGLNLHRTSIGFGRRVEHAEGAESMNPRCYELAATGTFFATDARAEVNEVFGDAVPTFRTARELEDSIRWWLARDDERRAVAASLPGLVASHTFDNRVENILAVLTHYK